MNRYMSLTLLVGFCALVFGVWLSGCSHGGDEQRFDAYPPTALVTSGPAPELPANQAAEPTAAVRFRVIVPDADGKTGGTAGALASLRAGVLPKVTFSLTQINIANVGRPVVTFTKIVTADGLGIASASFAGVPALPTIGKIHIDGGHIASHRDYQGARDLVPGDNTIDVVAKDSQTREDLVVRSLEQIVASSSLRLRIPTGVVSKLEEYVGQVDASATTSLDDMLTLFVRDYPSTTTGASVTVIVDPGQ